MYPQQCITNSVKETKILNNYVTCGFFKSKKKLIKVVIFEGRDTSLNLPERMKENHKSLQAVALMHRDHLFSPILRKLYLLGDI
jgi:hypothetical protein